MKGTRTMIRRLICIVIGHNWHTIAPLTGKPLIGEDYPMRTCLLRDCVRCGTTHINHAQPG